MALEMSHILAEDPDFHVLGLVMIDTPSPKYPRSSRKPYSMDMPPLPNLGKDMCRRINLCVEEAKEIGRCWQAPTWTAHAPAPAAVLVRAADFVNDEDDGLTPPSYVDRWRQDPALGWSQDNTLRVTKTLEAPGHHFSMFDRQNVSDSFFTHLDDSC